MGKQLSDEERIRNRRLFSWRTIPALGLGLFLGFFAIGVCGLKAYGAYDLPYSPDDAQFAQTLMNRGFDEEATRVYERIVHSDQAKPEAKLEAGLSLLGSHRDAVLKATDAADRDKHVKRVQDELDTLTAAYKGKQEPSALILEKALFLQTQGRVLANMLSRPADPKAPAAQPIDPQERARLVDKGNKYFDDALVLLVKAQAQAMVEEKPFEKDKEDKTRDMWLKYYSVAIRGAAEYGRTLRYQAGLYPSGADEWKKKMQAAVEAMDNFLKHPEYGSDMTALLIFWSRGQCHRDLGEMDAALKDFGTVVEDLKDPEQNIENLGGLLGLCAQQVAEIQTKAEKFDDAIKGLDELIAGKGTKDPRLMEQLRIAKAQVLFAEAEKGKGTDAAKKFLQDALGLVQNVASGSGPYAHEASDLVGKIFASGGPDIKLGPSERVRFAEEALNGKKPEDAVKQLEGLEEAPGLIDDIPLALRVRLDLGRAYRQIAAAAKPEDAIAALVKAVTQFTEAEKRFPTHALAPQAALELSATRSDIARRTKDPKDREAFIAALHNLADKYPTSPQASNANYYLGEGTRGDGKNKEAIELYKKVAPGTENYGRSQYLIGLCYYNLFNVRYDNHVNNDETREYLKQAKAQLTHVFMDFTPKEGETWHRDAALAAAELCEKTADPDGELVVLDNFDKKYPEEKGRIPSLLGRRISALKTLGRLDDAEKVVATLEATGNPDPDVLIRGYIELADAFFQKAKELEKSTKATEAKQMYAKSAGYYRKVMPLLKEDDQNHWLILAARFWDMQDAENALTSCQKLEKNWKGFTKPDEEKRWAVRWIMLRCMIKLNRREAGADTLALLEEIDKHFPGQAVVKMFRADVLLDQKKDESYKVALEIYQGVVLGLKDPSQDWDLFFKAQVGKMKCYRGLNDESHMAQLIKLIRALYWEKAPDDIKRQFQELEQPPAPGAAK
jgi:hypothetical protein